jgi:DNA-binding transcriptional LysR family regulator
MDKLSGLRAFVKVVEHGSFSEAARSLRLSRSAVSKYVIELEQELGVQLLNRTTRSASPTENGRVYYERALAILADLEEADLAVTRLQAEPRGLLRINAPMSFGTLHLAPALAEFMKKYPELQIQLTLSDEQIDAIQEGYDVTLRIAELAASSLIARRLIGVERVLCASPAYIQRRGAPEHPRDLKNHECLTYGFLATGNQWKLTGPDGEHALSVPWRLCANNAQVAQPGGARGSRHCAAADLHRRRGAAIGRAGAGSKKLSRARHRPLCHLSADPPPVVEGPAVHRFFGGALRRAGLGGRMGRLTPAALSWGYENSSDVGQISHYDLGPGCVRVMRHFGCAADDFQHQIVEPLALGGRKRTRCSFGFSRLFTSLRCT